MSVKVSLDIEVVEGVIGGKIVLNTPVLVGGEVFKLEHILELLTISLLLHLAWMIIARSILVTCLASLQSSHGKLSD